MNANMKTNWKSIVLAEIWCVMFKSCVLYPALQFKRITVEDIVVKNKFKTFLPHSTFLAVEFDLSMRDHSLFRSPSVKFEQSIVYEVRWRLLPLVLKRHGNLLMWIQFASYQDRLVTKILGSLKLRIESLLWSSNWFQDSLHNCLNS